VTKSSGSHTDISLRGQVGGASTASIDGAARFNSASTLAVEKIVAGANSPQASVFIAALKGN